MSTFSRFVGMACGAVALAGLLGCGGQYAERTKELKILGIAYHNYHDMHGRGPADAQAFLKWAQQGAQEAVGVIQQTAAGGTYTLLYGPFKFREDFPQGLNNTVLAYENVPSPGPRLVLLGDGSVSVMDEARFNAAPRPDAKGPTKRAQTKSEVIKGDGRDATLRAIGELYRRYWAAHKDVGPPGKAEIVRFANGLNDIDMHLAASTIGDRPGGYTVYFGCVRDASFPAGVDKTLLAHANAMPPEGGMLVLTADGKVWEMTPEAFAAAPRPKVPDK